MPGWDAVMRYGYSRACQHIRKRMPANLASQMDAEDIVSDAILSMLQTEGARQGLCPNLKALLKGSGWQLSMQYRRRTAAKRDGESPWPRRCRDNGLMEMEGGTTRVDSLMEANELREQILETCDPEEHPVFDLMLEDYTSPEIAGRLGLSVHTVHRLRRQISERTARLLARRDHPGGLLPINLPTQ